MGRYIKDDSIPQDTVEPCQALLAANATAYQVLSAGTATLLADYRASEESAKDGYSANAGVACAYGGKRGVINHCRYGTHHPVIVPSAIHEEKRSGNNS